MQAPPIEVLKTFEAETLDHSEELMQAPPIEVLKTLLLLLLLLLLVDAGPTN